MMFISNWLIQISFANNSTIDDNLLHHCVISGLSFAGQVRSVLFSGTLFNYEASLAKMNMDRWKNNFRLTQDIHQFDFKKRFTLSYLPNRKALAKDRFFNNLRQQLI